MIHTLHYKLYIRLSLLIRNKLKFHLWNPYCDWYTLQADVTNIVRTHLEKMAAVEGKSWCLHHDNMHPHILRYSLILHIFLISPLCDCWPLPTFKCALRSQNFKSNDVARNTIWTCLKTLLEDDFWKTILTKLVEGMQLCVTREGWHFKKETKNAIALAIATYPIIVRINLFIILGGYHRTTFFVTS